MHHLAYERLGDERDSDLEVLCRGCHEAVHQDESRRQHLGVYVKLVSDAIRAGAVTFADISAVVKTACGVHRITFDASRVDRAVRSLEKNRLPPPKLSPPEATPPWQRPSPRPFGRDEAASLLRSVGVLALVREMPSRGSLPPGATDQFRRDCGLWNRPDLEAKARCEEEDRAS